MIPLTQRLTERHPNLEPVSVDAAIKAVTEEAYWLIHDRLCELRRSPNLGDLVRMDELKIVQQEVFGLGIGEK